MCCPPVQRRVAPGLRFSAVVAACAVLVATGADAAPNPGDTLPGLVPPPTDLAASSLTAGVGTLEGDAWLALAGTYRLRTPTLALDARLPLHLLLFATHFPPAAELRTWALRVRKSDWPVPGPLTWGRSLALVESLRFTPVEALQLEVGRLADVSLGFGTLVEHFANDRDPVTPKAGLHATWGSAQHGLALVVDDLAVPATALVALRGWAAVDAGPCGRLALGVTGAADPGAPTRARTGGWETLPIPLYGFVPAEAPRPLGGAAIDLSCALATTEWTLQPYVALGALAALSTTAGAQLGVVARAPGGLSARAEARAFQPGFAPGYFDTTYELQRAVYVAGRSGGPKQSVLAAEAPEAAGPLAWGGTIETSLQEGPIRAGIQLAGASSVTYANHVAAFLSGDVGPVHLEASLARRGFTRWDDALADPSFLARLAARWPFAPSWSLRASAVRRWTIDPTTGLASSVVDASVVVDWLIPAGERIPDA